jgi:heme exporter protein CcmD
LSPASIIANRFVVMTDSIRSFLDMGGHAGFVWPAYALAMAVLGGLLGISLRSLRKAEAGLAAHGPQRPQARP